MDSQKIQTVLGFLFGVIFVSAILVIALFVPFPSDFQYQVFRIVLALAAGGVGAVIPGILNVNIPKLVTAGGALAVFVVVYFYSPAQLAVKQLPPQERLLELIYIGHNTKFGQWVQGHRYVGETGPAQKYLRDCADFLDEIKHPAAGQVHLWATQGDICTLADATNSTVSQILEPLAKGKTVAEPTLEHSHEGGCP